MPSKTSLEASGVSTPRPKYFLVRPTGEVVPLIAVDELPPTHDLIGLPRSLDLTDTMGMINLGLKSRTGIHYQLVTNPVAAKVVELTPPPSCPPKPELRKAISSTSSESSDSEDQTDRLAIKRPVPHTTAVAPPPEETPYCRHYCTYGKCKWHEDCRYLHEMPTTPAGLKEIGLTGFPHWFKIRLGLLNHARPSNDYAGRNHDGRLTARQLFANNNNSHNQMRTHARAQPPFMPRLARTARARPRRVSRDELDAGERGEQTMKKLGVMREEKEKLGLEKKQKLVGSAAVERASTKETINWEEESALGEAAEKEVRVSLGGHEKKLVDV